MITYKLIKERTKDKVYEIIEGYGKGSTTTSTKFPVIGGPLDKTEATRIDILQAGLVSEYAAYNRAYWCNRTAKQVFIHRSLLV